MRIRKASSRGGYIFLVLALIAAGALMYALGGLIKLLVISAFIAYILNPVVNRVEARGMGRTLATSLVFTGLAGATALSIIMLLPLLQDQVAAIQAGVTGGQADSLALKVEGFVRTKLGFLGFQDFDIHDAVHRYTADAGKDIFSYVLNAAELVADLVMIPFFVFFMLSDGRKFKRQLINAVPNRYFEFTLNLVHRMDRQLGNFLRGQVVNCLLIGILSVIALWILGIPYFLLIGAFTGLANLIPYVGPFAGAAVAIVVSVMDTGSFSMVLYIIIAFEVIRLIDNAVVKPVVVSRSVDIHPLSVLIAIYVGGKFYGILGMLLSIPVAAILKVFLHETVVNFKRYYQPQDAEALRRAPVPPEETEPEIV